MRNIINKINATEYLIKNQLDLKIYNEYLNNISIEYNELIEDDIEEKVNNFSLLYYNIYILY